jgi:hypothetical protein
VSLLALMVISAAGARAAAWPMNNEDVVQMLAAGRSEAEVRRAIESAERVTFELDAEMVDELKRAGVSDALLDAMRKRQAEMPQTAAPASPEPAPVARGIVELRFVPKAAKKPGERPMLQVPVEPGRAALMLPGVSRRDVVLDLAVFLLCGTARHVPDHWDDLTELKNFARHEMLLFQPSSRTAKLRGMEVREMEFPESLPASVDAGTHRLMVAVAMRIGPAWVVVASAERADVPVEAGKKTVMTVTVGDFRLAPPPKPGAEAKPEPMFAVTDVTPPEAPSTQPGAPQSGTVEVTP